MKIIKKKVFISLMAIILFVSTTTFSMTKGHAVVGTAIKIVAGSTVESALVGIGQKAGYSLGESQSAKEKSVGKWNLDAYNSAKDYEAKLNADERARYDAFQKEMASPKVTPVPGKKNVGKMLLTGASFLFGLDLIYSGYKAFQDGYANGTAVNTAGYGEIPMGIPLNEFPGFTASEVYKQATGTAGYIDYVLSYADGTVDTGTLKVVPSMSDWGGVTSVKTVKASETSLQFWAFYVSNPGGRHNASLTLRGPLERAPDEPYIRSSPISSGDVGKFYRPSGFGTVPVLPGTEIPDINQMEIHPNSIVEIEVPIDPSQPHDALNEPITVPEYQGLKEPAPGTDPGTEPGTGTDPKPGETVGSEPPIKEEELEGLGCKRIKKIDFEPLGTAVTTSFPFSIPWDIQRLLDSAFSEIGSEKPQFSLEFIEPGLRITIPSYFDSWVGFGKGLLLLGFDAGLVYLFYRFMKGSD